MSNYTALMGLAPRSLAGINYFYRSALRPQIPANENDKFSKMTTRVSEHRKEPVISGYIVANASPTTKFIAQARAPQKLELAVPLAAGRGGRCVGKMAS